MKSFNLSKKRGCVHVNCVQRGLEAPCCRSGRLGLETLKGAGSLGLSASRKVCVCVCVCVCVHKRERHGEVSWGAVAKRS